MAVRYKFKSEATFSFISFDGIYISVADVKKEIFRQRKLGRSEDVELLISNSESKEKYTDETHLIERNTSLIVVRMPVANNYGRKNPKVQKSALYVEPSSGPVIPMQPSAYRLNRITNNTDLVNMQASEEEKIMAMMMQSTVDYSSVYGCPSQPKQQPSAIPPKTYTCRKCRVPGHWIKSCPLNAPRTVRYNPTRVRPESTKTTGIPKTMLNAEVGKQFYKILAEHTKKEVPKDLTCEICKKMFKNPVITPCCKETFCNECIVYNLLHSDEYECIKCNEKYILPGSLKVDDSKVKEIVKFERENQKIQSENQKVLKENEKIQNEVKTSEVVIID